MKYLSNAYLRVSLELGASKVFRKISYPHPNVNLASLSKFSSFITAILAKFGSHIITSLVSLASFGVRRLDHFIHKNIYFVLKMT